MSATQVRRALEERVGALHREATVEAAPGTVDYDAAGPGSHSVAYQITVLVGLPRYEAVRRALDRLIEPDGVKAALEQDRTLGGLVTDLSVTKCSGYQLHRRDETDLLGATWTVNTLS